MYTQLHSLQKYSETVQMCTSSDCPFQNESETTQMCAHRDHPLHNVSETTQIRTHSENILPLMWEPGSETFPKGKGLWVLEGRWALYLKKIKRLEFQQHISLFLQPGWIRYCSILCTPCRTVGEQM